MHSPHAEHAAGVLTLGMDSPDQDSSGFEVMQQVLRKVCAKMEGNITLNEKWLALSTYLEGYFYDQDTATIADKCQEVLSQAAFETKDLPKPCMPLTAAGCVVMDRLINWVGHHHPPLFAVFRAVRQILYQSVFSGKIDMSFQDAMMDGDLIAPEMLPLAMSVYSEPGFFDDIKYVQAQRAAFGPPQEMQKKYDELNGRLEYWKKQHLKLLFTSWRSHTSREKHVKAEMDTLQQHLADVTVYNDQKMAEYREKCGRLERENEHLKLQLKELTKQMAGVDAGLSKSKAHRTSSNSDPPLSRTGSQRKGQAPHVPVAPPADMTPSTNADGTAAPRDGRLDKEAMAYLLDLPQDGRILLHFFNDVVARQSDQLMIDEFHGDAAQIDKLVNMISILMPDHLSPEAAKEAIANTGLQGKVELLGNALQGVGMAESVHVVQSMLQPREDGAALMELLVAQLFMWFALNAAGASQQERWAHCAMERLGACMMNVMLSEGVSRKSVFGDADGDYSKLKQRLTAANLKDVLPPAADEATIALERVCDIVDDNAKQLAGVFTTYAQNKAWSSTTTFRPFYKMCLNAGLYSEGDANAQADCRALIAAVLNQPLSPQPPAAPESKQAGARPRPPPQADGRKGYQGRAHRQEGDLEDVPLGLSNKDELGPAEWMEVVVRIAAQRSEEPLADKFEEVVNLVCGHIRALEAANFRLELQDWRVQKVIRGKRKKLIKLFRRYSGVLKGKTKDFDGITFAAFHQMLSDTNCYDLSFSQDAAAEAFSFSRSPLGEGWGMDPEALGFIEWMDAMMAVSVSKAPSPYLPMWQRIDTFLERLLRAHVPE